MKIKIIIIASLGIIILGVLFRVDLQKMILYAKASTKSTSQFLFNSKDSRVMYEPGAEKAANIIAQALPKAIETVEEKQYGKFISPIKIYVCASIESFKSYGANERAGGFTSNNRLFISPKSENTEERLPRVLTHELSHLLIEQLMGFHKWFSNCPVWFQEGLAVYVSNGCGAEGVTEENARELINNGKVFDPDQTGTLLHKRSASYFGLDEHVFYKQCSMFISYLHNLDNFKFKKFIQNVQDSQSFVLAFESAYGQNMKTVWDSFLLKMKQG